MTIRNLEYALRPRSIAVIGASDDKGSVGETLTENVLNGGFAGPVYLVNPKHRRIAGRDCLPASMPFSKRQTLRSSPRRLTPSLP
jgi:acetyltransferase